MDVRERWFVAVVGPTGSGKSELALRVAEEFGGEVVNCDSLQIYRYFDIGTAKLPAGERRGIPHHLIDVCDPDEVFTAGDYARRARPLLDEIHARGKLPVIAGGTGFYLRALIDGLVEGPARDDRVRARLAGRESRRPGSLARILGRLDPAGAARIHANDTAKLVRAIEVILRSGRRLSEVYAGPRDALTGWRFRLIGLNPPRDLLYTRLNSRCEAMFAGGLVEEVRSILGRGFPISSKPFESHGYKQAVEMIEGTLEPAEAVMLASRNTRHYAKRQMTWFRADSRVVWQTGFGSDRQIRDEVLDEIRAFERAGC